MTRRILLLIALLILTSGSPILAQIHISGPLSGVLVDTTYIVTGNISVPAGRSLLIQPGAVILFRGYYAFDIYGYLCAAGTESDSIVFKPSAGSPYWAGIDFNDSAADSSILEYCYLTGSHYGGIDCNLASPTISRCTIEGNWSPLSGGGINLVYSNATITHCTIRYNSAFDWGGGLCGRWSSPVISHCIISGNFGRTYSPEERGIGGGLWFLYSGSPTISNCLIAGNWSYSEGAGITCPGAGYPTISHCTIVGNVVGNPGYNPQYKGGVASANPATTLSDCILWGNIPNQIFGSARVIYSDIQHGWPGLGNINADPLFVSGPEGDYYLSQIAAGQTQQSPCVDAGDPQSVMILGTTRTDGVQDSGIVDMGFHYPLPADISLIASNREEELFKTYNLELRTSSFPNPFNATTVASYELRVASYVSLQVYDSAGRLVQTLADGWREAGSHEVTFDASHMTSGVFFCFLRIGETIAVEKILLLK